MKKVKALTAASLVVAMSIATLLTGCDQTKEQSVPVENADEVVQLENVGIDMDTAIPKLEKPEATQYYLVENGESSYKIVIPKESNEMLSLAAEELQYFVKEATGVELPIVEDNKVKEEDAVISLGATREEGLGTSGYQITTNGEDITIVGGVDAEDAGVLYGVYDFLLDAIDMKVYAKDEIVYTETDTVPLYQYDNVVNPSFDERSLSYLDLRQHELYQHRMRMFDLYTTHNWALYGHSQVSQIMPYSEERAEWYCPGGGQLCWAAGEEMEQEFARLLIEKIEERPEATYFMLGQEDTTNLCTCEKCLAAVASTKYGSYTGLQIAFLNNVIDIVEEWRVKNAPDRDLRFVCFAYNISLQPPVKEDTNGEMVVYHEDCQPADNLYILFAPIEADFSEELKSDVNQRTYNALLGWEYLVGDRVLVYEYDTNFRTYFINFDNFEVVQEHYQTYLDHSVKFMYSQGPVQNYITCFSEMRIFVESQLMWDISKDYNDLVNEFMAVYYQDAAPAMREYYDYLRSNYAKKEGTGQIYALLDQPDFYDFETIAEMEVIFEKALLAIEPLRKTDNELYETLYYRIKKEYLSVLWLKLNTFSLYYTEDENENDALEFYYLTTKLEISQWKEGHDISDMFYGFIREQ